MVVRAHVPAFFLIFIAIIASAGPLDPPAGPVTSTFKTLTEVEPRIAINSTNTPGDADSLFKITQPGSYYLAGNITGVAGKHGIKIDANGVTLDLNGFDLVGVPSMGAVDGVNVASDSLRNIAVINGSVRDWGDEGVDLGFLAIGGRVEGVRASGNAGIGINGGISCSITNCTASFNAQVGIRTNNGSNISNCSAHSNSVAGIQVNQGCVITGCSVYLTTGAGIIAGLGCTLLDCAAFQSTGHGIQIGDGSSATRCSAYSNGNRGISTGAACTISECTASFNTTEGILANSDSSLNGCTARSNGASGISGSFNLTVRGCVSSLNTFHGIGLSGGVVSECTTNNNGFSGISTTDSATIVNCSSARNTNHGISVLGFCLISGNICTQNGFGASEGYGIRTTGPGCQIVGNHCSFNDQGVHVNLAGNVVTGNTCRTNTTDWFIVAGNAIGPILDRRNPGGAAVNGFSAPTTLNTTDPHANFSH